MMKTVLVIGATSPTAQAFIALMARDYPEVNLKLFVRNLKKYPHNKDKNTMSFWATPQNILTTLPHSRMLITSMILLAD
ncbi:hypothetical protein L3X07_01255 [Levilactobacillus brevis]|nr:hypothetical protein [Levilactobacillus brevis]